MNIHMRMTHVIYEEYNNFWFVRTTKEIVRVQIFFDSFKSEFKDLKEMAKGVMKREKNILSFDWPDERTYDQWKTNHSMAIKRLHMVSKDKLINWVETEEQNNEHVQVVLEEIALGNIEEQKTTEVPKELESKMEIEET